LSITLAKGQGHGPVPATTGYAAFAGGFGILAGLIGVAALFFDVLNGIITWAVDALAALILLAGGIAYTIGLKGASCNKNGNFGFNKLLNCGYTGNEKGGYRFYCGQKDDNDLVNIIIGRCKEATADDAFLYMAFVVTVAVLGASFMFGRRKGGGSYVV
jgi:hypothetical protein